MPRIILMLFCFSSVATAQVPTSPVSPPVTDEEVHDLYVTCAQHKHVTRGRGVLWDDGYDGCGKVEAEWEASGARQRAKAAEDKGKIDSLLNRLQKP